MKHRYLLVFFLGILGIGLILYGVNYHSFEKNSSESQKNESINRLVSSDDYQNDVIQYVEESTGQTIYYVMDIDDTFITIVPKSKMVNMSISSKDYEKYRITKDLKIYENKVYILVKDGQETITSNEVIELTIQQLHDSVQGGITDTFVEFSKGKVVQVIVYHKNTIYKYD